MNLIRATSARLLRSAPTIKFAASIRGAQYLDDDWKPGKYPLTEAERLAAAKKYNLLPEEYEAYDPERWEFAYGDYPHLPNLHYADGDPYYSWDYMCHHRNFGEPWNAAYQVHAWWLPELRPEEYYPISDLVKFFIVISALMYGYTWLNDRYERIIVFKPMDRVDFPWLEYYHFPNSKLEYYDSHH